MIELASPRVRAVVAPLAAMLVDAAFTVDGREHRPLARAPWVDESGRHAPGLDAEPGHVRVLGGDFVALPFGSSGAPADLDAEWRGIVPAAAPPVLHGPAAEEEWTVAEYTDDRVRLVLDYPADSAIERVERTIALRAGAPAIDFRLVVVARRAGRVPLALHPILRIPREPRTLRVSVPFRTGFTYPGRIDPGIGPTRPWCEFSSLEEVPALDGGTVDLSRLPLDHPTQDNVLLADVAGPVVATFGDTGTRVTVDWDRGVLPSLMLWLSDDAIPEEPWSSRYRGLGVEPLAAAFDLPPEVSTGANPLSERGVATAVAIDPRRPLVVEHSILVEAE